MSKSKGNVIDPLELVDELRRRRAALHHGRRWPARAATSSCRPQRVEGYRNFGTKLWNAARFCEMNELRGRCRASTRRGDQLTLNRWIVGEVAKTAAEVDRGAGGATASTRRRSALYRFVWNGFCDWYLELAKPMLTGTDEAAKAETRAITAWVLDQILNLLHPIMPFVTEELWDSSADRGGAQLLMTAPWPELPAGLVDAEADGRDRLGDPPDLGGPLDPRRR